MTIEVDDKIGNDRIGKKYIGKLVKTVTIDNPVRKVKENPNMIELDVGEKSKIWLCYRPFDTYLNTHQIRCNENATLFVPRDKNAEKTKYDIFRLKGMCLQSDVVMFINNEKLYIITFSCIDGSTYACVTNGHCTLYEVDINNRKIYDITPELHDGYMFKSDRRANIIDKTPVTSLDFNQTHMKNGNEAVKLYYLLTHKYTDFNIIYDGHIMNTLMIDSYGEPVSVVKILEENEIKSEVVFDILEIKKPLIQKKVEEAIKEIIYSLQYRATRHTSLDLSVLIALRLKLNKEFMTYLYEIMPYKYVVDFKVLCFYNSDESLRIIFEPYIYNHSLYLESYELKFEFLIDTDNICSFSKRLQMEVLRQQSSFPLLSYITPDHIHFRKMKITKGQVR